MNKPTLLLLSFFIVSGCAVKGEYTCGVPNNGVRCQPMNETHRQLYDGSLNSLHVEAFPEEEESTAYDTENTAYGESSLVDSTPSTSTKNISKQSSSPLSSIKSIQSKQAILSPPREMRVWFDRFTDPDGDLHDESFMFIRLDHGHWMIDNKPVLY